MHILHKFLTVRCGHYGTVTPLLVFDRVQYVQRSGPVCAAAAELSVSTSAQRWQVERVHCPACLCHVTFSSSVNVVDYFLRDQNWLPGIRTPSIFGCTSRAQGRLCEAEAHGKESRFVCWWQCSHESRYSISPSTITVCCLGKRLKKKICFWNFTFTSGVLLLPSAAGLGGRKAGFSTLLEAWIRKRTQPTLYRYPHIPFCVYFGRCWIGVSFRTTLSLRQPSWLHSAFCKSSFSRKLSKPQCPFESWCMTVQKTIQWHSITQSIWKQLFPDITSQIQVYKWPTFSNWWCTCLT